MTPNFGRDVPAGSTRPVRRLRSLAHSCTAGSCPTVYEYEEGAGVKSKLLVVQGYAVAPAQVGIDVPDGEALVEVPLDLLKEALQKLS